MTKKEMIGRAYSSFTDKEKAEINKMISGTYYGMINGIEITDPYTLKDGEQVIIDLDNGLSVSGTIHIPTDDEDTDKEYPTETINENGVFYESPDNPFDDAYNNDTDNDSTE